MFFKSTANQFINLNNFFILFCTAENQLMEQEIRRLENAIQATDIPTNIAKVFISFSSFQTFGNSGRP